MNETIKKEIRELEKMKLPELQARYAQIVGEETKAPNKKYLIKRIALALEKNGAQTNEEPIEAGTENKPESSKLSRLDADTLRERYLDVVGRSTSSTDKRYLIWKIKQAEQGKVPVGPLPGRRGDGVERDYKILPVRMESDLVEKLDAAWQRQGLKSRMELFRRSLQSYLASVGENDLAERMVL
jgi:hypothetical protein